MPVPAGEVRRREEEVVVEEEVEGMAAEVEVKEEVEEVAMEAVEAVEGEVALTSSCSSNRLVPPPLPPATPPSFRSCSGKLDCGRDRLCGARTRGK